MVFQRICADGLFGRNDGDINKIQRRRLIMRILKNRKTLLVTSVVLALLIVMSATFAWITAAAQKENRFKNEGYDISDAVVINENFDDQDLPEIGEIKPKEVSIANTGSLPVLVRVTFEEMVKLLDAPVDGAAGDVTLLTKTQKDVPDATNGLIPVPIDGTSLVDGSGDATNGWTEITNKITDIGTTDPGVRIFEKNGVYNGYFLIEDYYGTDEDLYQKLSISLEKVSDDEYTNKYIKYGYYTEGTALFNSWNKKNNQKDASVSDWWNWTDPALSTTPAADTIGTFNKSSDILLGYNTDDFSTISSISQGTWVYNSADGYFYWIGVLGAGEFTPNMLTTIAISSEADQGAWKKYDYSLVVCLEVLQATKDALSDTEAQGDAAGWQLGAGDLLDALEEAIETYDAAHA
jgi:hypothetical protein